MENTANAVTTAENRVIKNITYGAIELARIYKGNYQTEGTLTAELKQTVVTKANYPTKSVASNMQDNIFAISDFGFETQDYESTEVRVAWIDVPESSTEEQIKAKLASLPNARIYKVLSNHPSLTDNQVAGIARGLTTKDIIANGQAVRYPANHPTSPNKLILDPNGKVQYRGVYFKTTVVEDMDKRTLEVDDFYITPELQAEIAPATATVAQDNIN